MYSGERFIDLDNLLARVRFCNYLTVAQIFLQDNFLLETPLKPADVKPRLLGHWGTCPGINLVYAALRAYFGQRDFTFVLGPGHGFPALQANLFYDGELAKVDPTLSRDYAGLKIISKMFSRIGGFPSHASPVTPGVICEGGELGYSLATAYGSVLNRPNYTTVALIGDGEFETATMLGSLNLNRLLLSESNGRVLPILHLNGYKISAPTVASRRSEHELKELIRGFGYTPILVKETLSDTYEEFGKKFNTSANFTPELDEKLQKNLLENLLQALFQSETTENPPFIIFASEKGLTGPRQAEGMKVRDNFKSHQVPLPNAKTDETELKMLEKWLKTYRFNELFDQEKGFLIHEN